MRIEASSWADYLEKAPEERKEALNKLWEAIAKNIPDDGFAEGMSYGFPAWVVPHDVFPAGYHCKPEEPLPFVSVASQKNFIALYHMGIYANPEVMKWFVGEWPKHVKTKLDMGKSCIRFKKMDQIPYELIGELMKKISCKDWIEMYETNIQR